MASVRFGNFDQSGVIVEVGVSVFIVEIIFCSGVFVGNAVLEEISIGLGVLDGKTGFVRAGSRVGELQDMKIQEKDARKMTFSNAFIFFQR